MASDLIQQSPATPAMPLMMDSRNRRKTAITGAKSPSLEMTWRKAIFSMASDFVEDVCLDQSSTAEHVWLDEARLRRLNFFWLGMSNFKARNGYAGGNFPKTQEIAAVSALQGIYRLLEKCDGPEFVECRHLLRDFLAGLSSSFVPVCGDMVLRSELCSLVLPRTKCRALVLCVGTLILGVICNAGSTGFGGRLEVRLAPTENLEYLLTIQFVDSRKTRFAEREFALASRLSGMLEAELNYRTEDDGLWFWLRFSANPGRH